MVKCVTLKKWVTNDKMCHTSKNGLNVEKWARHNKIGHTWKNGSHSKKWVKLEKNGCQLVKCVIFGNIGETWKNQTWKNGSQRVNLFKVEKWVTSRKIYHTWKNGWNVGKWAAPLDKMGHTWKPWKTGSQLVKIANTRTNGSLLVKWVILGKMGHTEENRPHLE